MLTLLINFRACGLLLCICGADVESQSNKNPKCFPIIVMTDMIKTYQKKISHERGITLTEMLVILFVVIGIFWGAITGARIGAEYGIAWIKVCGGIVGAIIGGLGVLFASFLVVMLFSLIGMIQRIMEPADLVCRCQKLGTPTPEHLIADTPIKQEAIAESWKLMEWPEFARIRSAEPLTAEILRARLAEGTLSEERITLAASLGDTAATALGTPPIEPVLRFKGWVTMPKDIQKALRSGLPPRLCIAWALSCVERVLLTFEREFHQDTRRRQVLGAVLMVLRENNSDAIELCKTFLHTGGDISNSGCRVLHRDLKERMKGKRSLGERAAHAVYLLARATSKFLEPDELWTIFSHNSQSDICATPQTRCDWSGPWYRAEDIAHEASQATTQLEAEYQWQREELIRMILSWERWDEDRLAWQKRVEEEWIPKVQARDKEFRFKIPPYVELIRKQLIPWRNPGK
jgi:hypothetical protein